MSATIIIFPIAAERRPVLASATERNFAPFEINHLAGGCPLSATALATEFTDHFLPVVYASIDLLEADEVDFEARCRGMLDAEGTAMIEELCAELQIVGQQMQIGRRARPDASAAEDRDGAPCAELPRILR